MAFFDHTIHIHMVGDDAKLLIPRAAVMKRPLTQGGSLASRAATDIMVALGSVLTGVTEHPFNQYAWPMSY